MQLPIYQFDAFTHRRFGGNPAAVVILEQALALSDGQMLAIAAENNLSETAFVSLGAAASLGTRRHGLRWFTPTHEVDLCGHATLATAAALREYGYDQSPTLTFITRSGELRATFEGSGWALDFPALPVTPIAPDSPLAAAIGAALGTAILGIYQSSGILVEMAAVTDIRALNPDFAALALIAADYVVVTAAAEDCDFVSRVFAPRIGINEDPVTGAAHCSLTPFWQERTGKHRFLARQVSARGGEIDCELVGQRVILRGSAVVYLAGHIWL